MGKHGVFDATRVQLPYLCYLGGESITNPSDWKVPLPTVPTVVQVASEDGECFYAMNGNFAQENSPGRIAQDTEQLIGPMSNMETLHLHAPSATVHLQYWHECGRGRRERAEVKQPPTGMLAWYKADAGIFVADTNPVPIWYDSSGNGYHITQAVGAQQPAYHTNTQNGLPAVRFDGGDWLLNAAFSDFPDSCSIYVAGTHSVTTTALVDITDAAGVINTGISLFQEFTHERFRIFDGGVIDAIDLGVNAPITGLFCGIYVASVAQDFYLNGALGGSAVPIAGALGNVLGRIYLGTLGGGTYNLNGDLFEVLIYTAGHGAVQRTQVEDYFNWKWALW